jgi:hypothetical protein
MPLSFSSISTFRNAVELLTKKESDQCHYCKEDICEFFKGKSFDDIWELQTRLREAGDIRVMKIRLQNSAQNTSKSEGFRLILCCNRKTESVNFLNIYPKKGKYGKDNQEREEYKEQMKQYGKEFKENSLVCHNINKLLAPIG